MATTRRIFLRYITSGIMALATGTGLMKFATGETAEKVVSKLVSDNSTFPWTVKKVAEYYRDPPPVEGVRYAMAIDTQACIGCRRCMYACIKENNTGRKSGIQYIRLLEMEESSFDLLNSDPYYTEAPQEDKWYLPAHCNQCEKPSCVQACPVTATWQEDDGIVVVDYNKCIGCRFCMVNCPYGARKFNWVKNEVPEDEINPDVPIRPIGVVEKCTFCIHRTRKGLKPRCEVVCPVGARKFGDIHDPDSEISNMLRTRRVTVLKEDMGNEPQVYYVG
ncbi:MAG: 4Fe-4S dicluster domain-containing protein [Methanosarcinaceae archaeon]|nr:4Fe-4S dicluster domain-containing protein [Methanosarcinaceae archaeon]